ncbi:DUF3164 family protein [Aquimarina sp. TRL1]|uniref:DUF3164 family protein n=1 Tax=Aquimarina sp. (strain TRL1) TaxID=2736252 RepID=UPI001588F53D|nr:DUF3164 family protein [Aquimarina sp. TRL1]QKX04861.1 DUF3164 family protein [Aquimarina sp. TRL1]
MKKVEDIKVNEPEFVSASNLSIDELQHLLTKRKKEAARERKKQREIYEAKREETVMSLSEEAIEISVKLQKFKEKVRSAMENQALEISKYGAMRSNSKGGFSIKNNAATFRIRRHRETSPTWDERSSKATDLLKEFLQDTVKIRNIQDFKVIMVFLEKNKDGDLEYQKVMHLLSLEDNYTDPRWKEGLRLLKESYNLELKGFGFSFETKNTSSDNNWETIPLNFSAI